MAVTINVAVGPVTVTASTDANYSPDVFDDMLIRSTVAAFQNWSRVEKERPGVTSAAAFNALHSFIEDDLHGSQDDGR